MRSNFRDLDAYRLAASIGDDLYRVVTAWDWYARRSVGMQLVRSVDLIGANIADWIARAVEHGLLSGDWLRRLEAVARTLSGLIRSRERP